MEQLKKVEFYGMNVSVFTDAEMENYIESSIKEKSKIVCYGFSFATIPYFRNMPELYFYSRSFDVLVCDGRIFYLFGKLLGFRFKSDLSIPNLVMLTLDIAEKNGYSVMIFGSKEEINRKASLNVAQKYPHIKVIPGINGYFNAAEEYDIVERINSFSPDILLIGISTPIKERFAYQYKESLNCRVIIPCGGMVDVLAGLVKLSPTWVKKLGFATLFRIAQEPGRLFFLHGGLVFHALFKIMPRIIIFGKIFKKKDLSFPGIYGVRIKPKP